MDSKVKSVYQNVELRKVSEGTLSKIISILEENEVWKDLMNFIPDKLEDGGRNFKRKYNEEHVRIIADHANSTGRKCTEILLEEWSTSGRIRPTLNTLKDVLAKAEIFKAADIIAHMLNEPIPRRPTVGPGAPINTDIESLLTETSNISSCSGNNDTTEEIKSVSNMIEFSVSNNGSTAKIKTTDSVANISMNMPKFDELLSVYTTNQITTQNDNNGMSSNYDFQKSLPMVLCEENPLKNNIVNNLVLGDKDLVHFNNEDLNIITKNFSHKIGSGGFGEVYIGEHKKFGILAVKRINQNLPYKDPKKLYNSEIEMLSKFHHKNIVPIIGFSIDSCCIVCEFIAGGSLTDNIAKKYLSEEQRIKIMLGTAEGLAFLHKGNPKFEKGFPVKNKETRFLHGDVKSDNILLTRDLIPKLCDFGLAKVLEETHFLVTSVIGTRPYMAPEWLNGTITQKADIFSFGIVLLEILTGLPARYCDLNLQHYIESCLHKGINISELLDSTVKTWVQWEELYDLSQKCINNKMYDRPSAEDVCNILGNCLNAFHN